MRQHVDEVDHDDVEVVGKQVVEFAYKAFAGRRVVELVVGETALPAETLELGGNQRSLVEVFPLLFLFVDPQVGKQPRYLLGHKAGEDGVAGILSGRWQD